MTGAPNFHRTADGAYEVWVDGQRVGRVLRGGAEFGDANWTAFPEAGGRHFFAGTRRAAGALLAARALGGAADRAERFAQTGDTEVLLEGLEAAGSDFLSPATAPALIGRTITVTLIASAPATGTLVEADAERIVVDLGADRHESIRYFRPRWEKITYAKLEPAGVFKDGRDALGADAGYGAGEADAAIARLDAHLEANPIEVRQARRTLTVVFDVTGLTQEEADVLAGEVQAQAEASEADVWRGPDGVEDRSPGHPDVDVLAVTFEETS